MSNLIEIDRDINIVDVAELNEKNKFAAAQLVMESLPAYYEVDGIDRAEMAHAVAELLGKPGSETERGFVALFEGNTVGIATYLRANTLAIAQLIGARVLLKQLSPGSARGFRDHLRHYDAGFEAPEDQSIYLARFAVEKSFRGLGLAGRMMDELLSLDDQPGGRQCRISLHVDQDNHRAITFYHKHGFHQIGSGKRYLTMACNHNES